MATDYTNPFASKKNAINFTLPFQRVWEGLGIKPGWGTAGAEFVSEGAPVTSNLGNATPRATAGTVRDSYVPVKKTAQAPLANPVVSAVNNNMNARSAVANAVPGATPATAVQSGARYEEMMMAKKLGQPYVPGQAAGTAQRMADEAAAAKAKADAAALDAERNKTIEANLAAVYGPLGDLLATQKKTAESRYATNQADIKNIFGALTKVADADRIRIDKQFTDSIAKQQMDLAARTAQQRSETAAGVAQAEATGAERGAGPGMAVNPISVAAEEGISNANAIMSNWQGLMQANQAQAQIDVNNRGAGYGQQQVGALAALSKNFEDTMSNLGTQEATLKSQIAQAKIDAQNAYAAGDAAAAAAAQKTLDALNLQLLKNEGSQNVANTQAQAKLAGIQMQQQGANNRAAASDSTSTKKYSKDIYGFQQRLTDAGVPFDVISASIEEAAQLASQRKNASAKKTAQPGKFVAKAPSKAEIMSAWKALGFDSAKYGTYARDYVDNYYNN